MTRNGRTVRIFKYSKAKYIVSTGHFGRSAELKTSLLTGVIPIPAPALLLDRSVRLTTVENGEIFVIFVKNQPSGRKANGLLRMLILKQESAPSAVWYYPNLHSIPVGNYEQSQVR